MSTESNRERDGTVSQNELEEMMEHPDTKVGFTLVELYASTYAMHNLGVAQFMRETIDAMADGIRHAATNSTLHIATIAACIDLSEKLNDEQASDAAVEGLRRLCERLA